MPTTSGQSWTEVTNVTVFENFKFLPKTGFLSHNFVSRCASKSIKGSKTRFRVTNPKNLWAKKVRIGLAPRARQRCQKCTDSLSLWRNTQKNKIQAKKYFFDLKLKTCRIHRGFDQLPSSIGRQVMTSQSLGHYSGFAVLKGLTNI